MASKSSETSLRGSLSLDLLDDAAEILEAVDALPRDAAGVLSFGEDGLILVEDRKICWVVARDMPLSLTALLSEQHEPPVASRDLERIYRRCKLEHRPLGSTLVESGLVSADEVRAAFGMHHAGAIAQLARGHHRPTRFEHAVKSRDDRRFAFGTAEALASLSPPELFESAAHARRVIAELSVRDATLCAFQRRGPCSAPHVLAVDARCELGASQVRELARWAADTLIIAASLDASVNFVSSMWAGASAVLCFRDAHANYVALCSSRPASALLTSSVTRRLADAGSSGSWIPSTARRP